MKKFHLQVLYFLGIFIILFHLIPIYRYYSKQYLHGGGGEIFQAIDKSETTKKQKIQKIYLGDSVDEQIVSSKNLTSNELNLSTNQAISLVGQYIILSNLIENKNKIDTVELRLLPFSFANNLDNHLTFQYFLKPFYKKENYKYLSPTIFTQIEKIPFYYLAQYFPVLTTLWSPNVNSPTRIYKFSPVNKEYFQKIITLCKERKIYLILRPSPISETKKNEVPEYIKELSKAYPIDFKTYIEEIKYYPGNLFLEDQIHFKKEYLSKNLY